MAVITSAIYMLMPSLDAVQIAQPGQYLTRISTARTHLRGQRTRSDHHGPAEQEADGAWSTCSPPARGPESHQTDCPFLTRPHAAEPWELLQHLSQPPGVRREATKCLASISNRGRVAWACSACR